MKITLPKVLGVGFAAVLLGYTFVFAPRLPGVVVNHVTAAAGASQPPAPTRHASAPPQVFPPAGRKFVGIMTNAGPYDFTALDQFTSAVDRQPSVYEFAQGWALNQFNRGEIDQVASR